MAGPLAKYVSAFVDTIDSDLAGLAGESHRDECLREASDLVSALLDADGRLSDAELRAWLEDLGSLLTPPVIVTPERLREGEMLNGTAPWLERPSTLFDLLLEADARDGERRANRYYDVALKLAHATAAIDLVPSPDEIAAIDRFRSTLLQAMDATAVPRPGQPTAAAAAGAPLGSEQPVSELAPERPLEELLAELDELIGLDHVKEEIRRLTSLLRIQKIRTARDLPTVETSHHLVFTGNPGTGKTTVARLLSQIYRTLDVVTRGHLVETDRSQLVAGYVGQTAARTRAVLESALGGTLLIDEAYALARGGENDFGLEAIDTLVKFMEDHRDDLAVVAAGYPDEMRKLIDANPGLESRFTRTIDFPDYTNDELVAIFDSMSSKKRYDLDAGARQALTELVAAEPRSRGFGNARFVRNVFEQAVSLQAMRLAAVEQPTDEQLTTLDAAQHQGRLRRMRFRDRFFTPATAKAIVSWRIVLGVGVAVALAFTPIGIPAAIGVGLVAYVGLVVVAMPKDAKPPRIDPFTLREPWRQMVQGAQRARGRLHETVGATAAGPLRERLEGIVGKLDQALAECWAIARRGDEIDRAVRRLDPTALRSKLETFRAEAQGDLPSGDLAAAITSVEGQLASADRLKELSAQTAGRLRLTQTRLDELVARTAEVSIGASDTDAYAHDVDDLVIEIEAMRLAVEDMRSA